MAIDGADEVDPNLDVVKGRGGALLREKVRGRALLCLCALRCVLTLAVTQLPPRMERAALCPVCISLLLSLLQNLSFQLAPLLPNRCRWWRWRAPSLCASLTTARWWRGWAAPSWPCPWRSPSSATSTPWAACRCGGWVCLAVCRKLLVDNRCCVYVMA